MKNLQIFLFFILELSIFQIQSNKDKLNLAIDSYDCGFGLNCRFSYTIQIVTKDEKFVLKKPIILEMFVIFSALIVDSVAVYNITQVHQKSRGTIEGPLQMM